MGAWNYITNIWAAILGKRRGTAGIPGEDPELRARIAALEMDVRERDEKIRQMQAEYAGLSSAAQKAASEAGHEELERVFKNLAGPMSSLSALAALSESGEQVASADLVTLFRMLEKELGRAGMERIGSAGETLPFDVARHQRMSGGAVRAGVKVRVRVPGFSFHGKVLLKAMVSAVEDKNGTDSV